MGRLRAANTELMLQAASAAGELAKSNKNLPGLADIGRSVRRLNDGLDAQLDAALSDLDSMGALLTDDSVSVDDVQVSSPAQKLRVFAQICHATTAKVLPRLDRLQQNFVNAAKGGVSKLLRQNTRARSDAESQALSTLATELAETFKLPTARFMRERPIERIISDVQGILAEDAPQPVRPISVNDSQHLMGHTETLIDTLTDITRQAAGSEQGFWQALIGEVQLVAVPVLERLRSQYQETQHLLRRAKNKGIGAIRLKQRALEDLQSFRNQIEQVEGDISRRLLTIIWTHTRTAHKAKNAQRENAFLQVIQGVFGIETRRTFAQLAKHMEQPANDLLLPDYTSKFRNYFLTSVNHGERIWHAHYKGLVAMLHSTTSLSERTELMRVLQCFHQYHGQGAALHDALGALTTADTELGETAEAAVTNNNVKSKVQAYRNEIAEHYTSQYERWRATLQRMIDKPGSLAFSKAGRRKRMGISEHLYGILRNVAFLSTNTISDLRSFQGYLPEINKRHPDAPRFAYEYMQTFYRSVLLGIFAQLQSMDLVTLRMHFPGDSEKGRMVDNAKHALERLRREMGFIYGLQKNAKRGQYDVAIKTDVRTSRDQHRYIKALLSFLLVLPVFLMGIGQGAIAAAGAFGVWAFWPVFIIVMLASTAMNHIFMFNDSLSTLYNMYRKDDSGRVRLFSGLSPRKSAVLKGTFVACVCFGATIALFTASQMVSVFAIILTGGKALAFGAAAIVGGAAMLYPPVWVVAISVFVGVLTLVGMTMMTYAGIAALIRSFKWRSVKKFMRRLIDVAGYRAYARKVDAMTKVSSHQKRHLKRRKFLTVLFKPAVFVFIILALLVSNFVSFFTFQAGARGIFADPTQLLIRAEKAAKWISYGIAGVGVPINFVFNINAAGSVAKLATHIISRTVARAIKRFFTREGRQRAKIARKIRRYTKKEPFKYQLQRFRFWLKKVALWLGTLINGIANGAANAPEKSFGVQVLGGRAAHVPAMIAAGVSSVTLGAIYSHGEVLVHDLQPLPMLEVPDDIDGGALAAMPEPLKANPPSLRPFEPHYQAPRRIADAQTVSLSQSTPQDQTPKQSTRNASSLPQSSRCFGAGQVANIVDLAVAENSAGVFAGKSAAPFGFTMRRGQRLRDMMRPGQQSNPGSIRIVSC